MFKPLVSVIICTYNRSSYLGCCLESLNIQTYSNYEIIVVNGPSTDTTDLVLSAYPHIKKLRQETLSGLSAARNLGLRTVSGEIIAFIDDDAIADKNWLENLVLAYDNEAIGGVGGPVFEITGTWYQFKNGYISRAGIPSFINEKDMEFNDPLGEYFNYIMGTNASFRKDILFQIGLFDENYRYYLDETDVCVQIIKHGYKIKHIDNAVVYHEMAEGHNRSSPYDINYSEILKNVVYFILKNFNSGSASSIRLPVSAMLYWIRIDYLNLKQGNITLYNFMKTFFKIMWGSFSGYSLAIKTL